MGRKKQWRLRASWAAIASATLLALGMTPASADVVRNVTVGSSPSVVALTSYYDNITGKTVSLSYAPTFTNHTTFSVNVTTFQVCFSQTGGGTALVKPQVRNADTVFADFGYVTMWSGTCQTFNLYQTYSAAPGSELFRIVGALGGNGGPEGSTVGGFYR